ncbi:MAG: hypothetical protein LC127_07110, partial [Chitinophagales bacterium]|nr:hypothetical protein [Chitinophagales bacterium]
MKVIKMIVLSVCFILGSQSTYAQEDDINSAENKAYSNFDFIAGTKTIFYDDFTAGLGNWKIIEFDQAEDVEPPQIKNIPNENGQWFKVPRRGIFYPIKVKELPEKFTIEFDMWV